MEDIYKLKNSKKYCNLIRFGNSLDQILDDCHFIINEQNKDRVEDLESLERLALSILLMDQCNFRVGNLKYRNSTGLLSIETKHFDSQKKQIEFVGKKRVINSCFLENRELIEEIRTLWDKVDRYDFSNNQKKLLFSYNSGSNHVSPDDLNDFLKIYHPSFSAKMFRTWKANLYFLEMLKTNDIPKNSSQIKNNIKTAIQYASQKLYNTPGICKRSYIDNRLIEIYQNSPEQIYKSDLVDLLKTFCN